MSQRSSTYLFLLFFIHCCLCFNFRTRRTLNNFAISYIKLQEKHTRLQLLPLNTDSRRYSAAQQEQYDKTVVYAKSINQNQQELLDDGHGMRDANANRIFATIKRRLTASFKDLLRISDSRPQDCPQSSNCGNSRMRRIDSALSTTAATRQNVGEHSDNEHTKRYVIPRTVPPSAPGVAAESPIDRESPRSSAAAAAADARQALQSALARKAAYLNASVDRRSKVPVPPTASVQHEHSTAPPVVGTGAKLAVPPAHVLPPSVAITATPTATVLPLRANDITAVASEPVPVSAVAVPAPVVHQKKKKTPPPPPPPPQPTTKKRREDSRFDSLFSALLAYKAVHNDMEVPRSFVVPSGDTRYPPKTWGKRLGSSVANVRNGVSFKEHRAQLEQAGFRFSARPFIVDDTPPFFLADEDE